MKQTKRINVTFDDETYSQIKLIAHKEGIFMSELVREWTLDSLNGQVGKDNINLITTIMREQIKDILSPNIERLAALSAKTCVQAGTSAYLTAETISKFVAPHLQEEVKDTYEKARKKAVIYTKQKGSLE